MHANDVEENHTQKMYDRRLLIEVGKAGGKIVLYLASYMASACTMYTVCIHVHIQYRALGSKAHTKHQY